MIFATLTSQQASSQTPSYTTGQTTTRYSTVSSITTGFFTTYVNTTNTTMIHFDHQPDDFNYQTGNFTLGQYEYTAQRFTMPFQVFEPRVCLRYDGFVFHASASQHLRAHFASDNPINFYVMDFDQLLSFYGYYCGSGYFHSEFNVFGSSYDLDWTVPQTGGYIFLFTSNNRNENRVTIHFNATSYSTTIKTTTFSYTLTTTSLVQEIETLAIPTSSNSQSSSENLLLPSLAVLGFLVALSVVALQKRRGGHQSKVGPQRIGSFTP